MDKTLFNVESPKGKDRCEPRGRSCDANQNERPRVQKEMRSLRKELLRLIVRNESRRSPNKPR